MPIDTDVETREKCFGNQDMYKANYKYCFKRCCYIERDLCHIETIKNLDIIREGKHSNV
jgi:hypothetical protein